MKALTMKVLMGSLALVAAPAARLSAQSNPAAQPPAAARRDSAAPPPAPKVAPPIPRASWLSDRLPLRIGDLVTIIVDEAASASERVSTQATADRAMKAKLGIGVDKDVRLGPGKDFETGLESSSREQGESGRRGELTAVLTVRITDINAGGVATVEGSKNVTVDGRTQLVQLKGVVRAEDVSASNTIPSSRVADAVITYKGKKIGPKAGILGKILSILWP